MAVHEQKHRFTLPDNQTIEVRKLTPGNSVTTLAILRASWEATYVAPGWLPLDTSRSFTDPDTNSGLIGRLAGRIKAGNEALLLDRPGSFYLGAFALDEYDMQIGMAKYNTVEAPTILATQFGAGTHRGEVDEINTLPGRTGKGVGRCMAYVMLLHGREVGHLGFGLEVVQRNLAAIGFYERQLAMRRNGETSLGEGMPPEMNRDVMVGIVPHALKTLSELNPWLVAEH